MKDFVPYELAVKLKEKGFREDCIAQVKLDNTIKFNHVFDNNIHTILKCHNKLASYVDAPIISQVLKWLREEKNIFVVTFIADDSNAPLTYEIYRGTECLLTHHGKYFTLQEWDKCNLVGIDYVIDNNLI